PKQRVTLVAVRTLDRQPRFTGVASYFRINDSTAEVAFAVDDHFHGKGIATAMLERLALVAASSGFVRFQATTLSDNRAMLEVFRDSGFTIRSKPASGSVDVVLSLTPSSKTVVSIEERERLATAASIRPFLQPQAVAVIGASRHPTAIGRRLLDALGDAGYQGHIYPVHPSAGEIAGIKAYPSVRDIPGAIDLALVAVPKDAVFRVVDDCAEAGVKALVVITAGFAECGGDGAAVQQQLVEKVRGYGMRMIGPNCMGVLNTDPRICL